MQFTHTLSLHDVCDDLHPDLLAAVLELTCDREIVIEVIDYHKGTTSATGPDPTEWDYDMSAELLAWELVTQMQHRDELPLHIHYRFSKAITMDMWKAITMDMWKAITADINKFIVAKITEATIEAKIAEDNDERGDYECGRKRDRLDDIMDGC